MTSRRPTNFKQFENHRVQKFDALQSPSERCGKGTLRSESRYALRLRYVDLVVSIEAAVEVCCFTVCSS
jgi:hypothetical protein